MDVSYCIDCGSKNLVYDPEWDGYICTNCGYMFRLLTKNYLNPENEFFKHCPFCGSDDLLKSKEEVSCNSCGLVIYDRRIDEEIEEFVKGLPLERQIDVVEIDKNKIRIDFVGEPIMLIQKDDERLSLEVFSDMFVKIRLRKGGDA